MKAKGKRGQREIPEGHEQRHITWLLYTQDTVYPTRRVAVMANPRANTFVNLFVNTNSISEIHIHPRTREKREKKKYLEGEIL